MMLRSYMGDHAISDLRRAGFTFVRLAVEPEFLLRPDASVDPQRIALVTETATRFERNGLGVMIEIHPAHWRLEKSETDRAKLLLIWRGLAPALGRLDPRLTFPEVLNEPVFGDDPAAWEALQGTVLAVIRGLLPNDTVILTGNQWGSLDGLLRLHPLADPNVVYSFHFYEPTSLTTLGAYQHGLDEAALAASPFPVADPARCMASAEAANEATRKEVGWYCIQHWDAARLKARIALAGEWGRRNNVAVLAGEFGARDRLNRAARQAWLEAARSGFEAAGIGWALWGYDDSFGFAVTKPPGDAPVLSADVLHALRMRLPSR
jgi:endoglucanase